MPLYLLHDDYAITDDSAHAQMPQRASGRQPAGQPASSVGLDFRQIVFKWLQKSDYRARSWRKA